ncbi:MAG: outer membrane protein transport protein, partial [Paramuribaculum sp.]|nr:outer membrane protein transport protein [Paramuribaculum sp.]
MIKRIATALAATLCMCVTVKAEGYQINTLSARQLGMGHTGTALHLGAESMIFNPAGMGFANTTFDVTGSITGIKANATTIHEGKKYTTDNGISTPLALNASFRIYDNLQAGVAFYTPYGSSIDWGRDWPGAVLNSSVDLKMFTLQPTFAWRITPRLSVGAGLMITWG